MRIKHVSPKKKAWPHVYHLCHCTTTLVVNLKYYINPFILHMPRHQLYSLGHVPPSWVGLGKWPHGLTPKITLCNRCTACLNLAWEHYVWQVVPVTVFKGRIFAVLILCCSLQNPSPLSMPWVGLTDFLGFPVLFCTIPHLILHLCTFCVLFNLQNMSTLISMVCLCSALASHHGDAGWTIIKAGPGSNSPHFLSQDQLIVCVGSMQYSALPC